VVAGTLPTTHQGSLEGRHNEVPSLPWQALRSDEISVQGAVGKVASGLNRSETMTAETRRGRGRVPLVAHSAHTRLAYPSSLPTTPFWSIPSSTRKSRRIGEAAGDQHEEPKRCGRNHRPMRWRRRIVNDPSHPQFSLHSLLPLWFLSLLLSIRAFFPNCCKPTYDSKPVPD